MSAPWRLTVWLICQNGRPFDYRFSRAAAFGRAAALRLGAPSGGWSVEERCAHLSLVEQAAAVAGEEQVRSEASEPSSSPDPIREEMARALESLHDAARLVSVGEYNEEALDIALDAARTALSSHRGRK